MSEWWARAAIGGSRTLNQAEMRQMAEERIKDANALLKSMRCEFA
jgi:hypothetical protein